MTLRSVLSLLAAIFALCGCRSANKPDMLVVLVDTLRADRVGVYGGRDLTPFVDTLAARAHVFRRAYAQSSWTNPSVASLLTSRYQSQHRITWFDSVLSADEVTLPEVFRQNGYATAGFSANPLVQGKSGYDQGFDVYQTYARSETGGLGETILIKERAEKINRESLAWLDGVLAGGGKRKPVFLYLHYMEPHNPYDPPEGDLARILAGRAQPDRREVNDSMAMSNVVEFSDELVQAVRDFYDAEVISVDRSLRELFDALAQRHFLDNAIVVFTADHGEEFMEHGRVGHDRTLYEEVIRIPMLLGMPGQKRRVDVERPVMTVDIGPTLLELAGIAAAPSFEGESWVPMLERSGHAPAPAPDAERSVYSQLIRSREAIRQSPHENAIVRGGRKLIRGVDGEQEFYDLRSDPGEHSPNGLGANERAALSDELQRFLDAVAKRAVPGAVRTLDAETRERMRALGYHE